MIQDISNDPKIMSCLRPDAENVKLHLRLHGHMSQYRGWRG